MAKKEKDKKKKDKGKVSAWEPKIKGSKGRRGCTPNAYKRRALAAMTKVYPSVAPEQDLIAILGKGKTLSTAPQANVGDGRDISLEEAADIDAEMAKYFR